MMDVAINFEDTLVSVFDNVRTIAQIKNAIAIVLDSSPTLSAEEQLDMMIDFLAESGFDDNDDEEGAVGYNHNNDTKEEIKKILPDISLQYLEKFCEGHKSMPLPEMIAELTQKEYEMEERSVDSLSEHLKDMLPDADPRYLEKKAKILANKSSSDIAEFIQNAIEKADYPTYQDYLKHKETIDALSIYKSPFKIEQFLEQHPNPIEEFSSTKRKGSLSDDPSTLDIETAQYFLYNHFNYLRKNDIDRAFKNSKFNLIYCNNVLKRMKRALITPRAWIDENETQNVALLQEMTFIRNEKVIKQYLKQQDENYKTMFDNAKKYGLLETCRCCYDDELIPEEVYFCNENCVFCKGCVKSGAEVVIGRGETTFPCFSCNSEFNYTTLRMVLDKKIFQRLCQRRQMEEVQQANIEGIESCPFCDFSMIPLEGDQIFKCENPDCMKQSCRNCRQPPHVPLKCSEVEYDEDVKLRTYIENKMTEALVRVCSGCSKKFVKETGCNKMTCVCGVFTCYLCGQNIKDYNHFGSGRCPLYTENIEAFDTRRVLAGANKAKEELGLLENPEKLKFDPTKNFQA